MPAALGVLKYCLDLMMFDFRVLMGTGVSVGLLALDSANWWLNSNRYSYENDCLALKLGSKTVKCSQTERKKLSKRIPKAILVDGAFIKMRHGNPRTSQ